MSHWDVNVFTEVSEVHIVSPDGTITTSLIKGINNVVHDMCLVQKS